MGRGSEKKEKRGGRSCCQLKTGIRDLSIYADLGVKLVEEFCAKPNTHRTKICTRFINQPLRDKLRKMGYDIRVIKIKGELQTKLEGEYK